MSRRACLCIRSSALLWIISVSVTLFNSSCAFVIHHPTTTSTKPSCLSPAPLLLYVNQEESEWYTPPPAIKKETQSPRTPKTRPTETIINSLSELKSFLHDDSDKGTLTIIKYHASWCKTCARFKLRFDKVQQKYATTAATDTAAAAAAATDSDTRLQIRFGSVEFGANSALCHAQNIEKLPTTRFYINGETVQEFTSGGSQVIQPMQDAILYYMNRHQRLMKEEAKKVRAAAKGTGMVAASLEQTEGYTSSE